MATYRDDTAFIAVASTALAWLARLMSALASSALDTGKRAAPCIVIVIVWGMDYFNLLVI